MTIEFVIFGSVIFGIAAGLLLERTRARIDPVPQPANALPSNALRLTSAGNAPQVPGMLRGDPRVPAWFDSAAQLRLVTDASFSSKRLLSDSEARVLEALEIIIADMGQNWRVMAQVNLSEIVASADLAAISAIDDQRVDLLIVSAQQMPIAAVEYQTFGQIREEDAIRDAVKREALRRAGIAYVEVRSNDTPGSLRADIAHLVDRHASAASAAEAASEPQPQAPPPSPAPRKPRSKAASAAKP